MRAILLRDRVLSKFDNRSYSKSEANDQANVPTEVNRAALQAKQAHLVKRILNYVKTWRKQQKLQLGKVEDKIIKENSSKKMTAVRKVSKASLGFSVSKPKDLDKNPYFAKNNQYNKALTKINHRADKVIPPKAFNTEQKNPIVPVGQEAKNLLTYPVIPLNETIHRYLTSIRPFFGKETFRRERKLTIDFMKHGGSELQMLLENAGRHESNWLSGRWTNATYLRQRAPVTVYSSPCITFPIQDFRDPLDYVNFAAKAIYRMCEFKNLIDENRIPVHRIDIHQLDNSQFRNVYGTVRLPKPFKDVLKQFSSNYVVVIHKNNFYKLPVYNNSGCLIGLQHLTNELLNIVRSKHSNGPKIGLLSHDKRDNWAEAHAKLCLQEINRNTIKCIEESLFTVSLDKSVEVLKGQKRTVLAHQLLHGGGLKANSANRWMDKTLQLIVNPNGMVGLCFEQGPADPQPAAMIMSYVENNIDKPVTSNVCSSSGHSDCYGSEHLKFGEINDCIELWLATAKRNIDKIHKQLRIHTFKFSLYGWCLIKSHGLSPDGFIQMALQLAFYRLHKQLPAQQEAAHLRIFQGGRTEVIRSTSIASWTFVFTMVSKAASPSVRLLALRNAVAYHLKQTNLALRGRGVDRHLFGLRQMAHENARPLPDFFNSKGYLKSTRFRLISSQASTPHDAFMAYGPYTSEGYSCSYNPRANDIIIAIASWKSKRYICAKRFGKALEQALVDMGEILVEREAGMC